MSKTPKESLFSFFRRRDSSPEDHDCKRELENRLTGKQAAGRQLSDAGQFAYAGLCGIALLQLYPEEEFEAYKKECINNIVRHINQCDQVHSSVQAIMNGRGHDCEKPFIQVINEEEVIKRDGCNLLINDFIAANLQNGSYDARTRILAKHLARLLNVNWQEVEDFEQLVVKALQTDQHEMTEEEHALKKKKELKAKIKKYALIGVATVGGGTLIGLTGGLAAPFIAGAVLGSGAAAALGTAGIAVFGTLFGVAGAGLTGYKMKKRIGDIEEFEFQPITSGQHLAVTIAVSGWLTDSIQDFRYPWRNLSLSREQFVLKYESKYLHQMGQAIDYLLSFAVSAAAQEALQYTILSSLLAAIAWPATVLSAASIIDNPWGVCTQRSAAVGRHLAEVLLSRQQGRRPISLIGFSLGARVIFFCLQEMSKRKNCEGIIEDVVLLGAPVTASKKEWASFRKVVAGRIVNGFCRKDWLLKFLYRTTNIQYSIAGLERIDLQDRRMHNFDLTEIVNGHMDYMNKMDEILQSIGVPCKRSFQAIIPGSTSLPTDLESSMPQGIMRTASLPSPCYKNNLNNNVTDEKTS